MKKHTAFVLSMGLMLLAPAVPALQQGDVPTYANLELVSVDPVRRLIVTRNSKGVVETFDMDDLLASTGGVKAGDRVLVTLHGGLGRRRISAITKAGVASGPSGTATRVIVPDQSDTSPAAAKAAFSRQVASLSQDARPIDAMWTSFVTACDVKPVAATDGRPWFGLWDNRVQADYSNGPCRELFNQMVAAGEIIKSGMAAAEEVARKSLTPGEIRDIRKVNLMNWDGWTLAPPQKREP